MIKIKKLIIKLYEKAIKLIITRSNLNTNYGDGILITYDNSQLDCAFS